METSDEESGEGQKREEEKTGEGKREKGGIGR